MRGRSLTGATCSPAPCPQSNFSSRVRAFFSRARPLTQTSVLSKGVRVRRYKLGSSAPVAVTLRRCQVAIYGDANLGWFVAPWSKFHPRNWAFFQPTWLLSYHLSQLENFIFFLPSRYLVETNMIGSDMGHPKPGDCTGRVFWVVCDDRRMSVARRR